MVGWTLLAVLGLVLAWLVLIYNSLVSTRNDVQSSWKQIDVQLKRRHDLIPNPVQTVKGAMEFEQDTLETTVAASLFGTFSSVVEKLDGTASRGRAFSSPAFLLAWLLLKLSYVLNMFISREREYRADAASVRMTRNPVALAETLHLLSRSWRGAGFIGSGLEMLCIVNPEVSTLDETEGFWADLLSTHPPLVKRMEILLRMARISAADLDARTASQEEGGQHGDLAPVYYAMNPHQQWQGPFTPGELGMLPWLSPLTWLSRAARSSRSTAHGKILSSTPFLPHAFPDPSGRTRTLSALPAISRW